MNKKTQAAFAHRLRPIVCVGERLEERDANLTERVITTQVRAVWPTCPPAGWASWWSRMNQSGQLGPGGRPRRRMPPTPPPSSVHCWRRCTARMRPWRCAFSMVAVSRSANVADFAALADIDGSLVGGRQPEAGLHRDRSQDGSRSRAGDQARWPDITGNRIRSTLRDVDVTDMLSRRTIMVLQRLTRSASHARGMYRGQRVAQDESRLGP